MQFRITTALALLLALASCGNSGSGQTPAAPAATIPNVEVSVARSRDVPQETSYASTVEAYAVNNIMPQSGGRIRKINVEVGDYVQKGQVLAEMDRLQLDQLALQIQNDEIEYERLKQHFLKERPITGIKEYADWSPFLAFEIDAGLIVCGLSPTGTAFAAGSATFFRDTTLRRSILKTAEQAGTTVRIGRKSHYLLADFLLVGEAIMLAMRTNAAAPTRRE